MSRLALSLLVALALIVMIMPAASAQGDQPTSFSLTLLHTNDTHANIEPCTTTCSNPTNVGGVARRYTAIQQVKAQVSNVLLVDAGDYFQGTLFFNYWQGQEASHFMNLLGYQAAAIGNHEFDSGPPALARYIQAANFPVLGANIDASTQVSLTGLIEPYTVVQVGGESIGIFGLTTEETPILSSPGPNVLFNDHVAAAQATVAALQGMGVNKIVALSHLGYTVDQPLGAAVSGIDVIVGGHSHTPLGPMPGAVGPYPTVVTSPAGQPVLVVSAWEWGKYLGRLDITFDDAGVVQSYQGAPILIDSTVAEDPAIAAEVAVYKEPINQLQNTVIGQTEPLLEGTRAIVRTRETNLGNLICDALLWKTEAQGTQICITNGGGIRASIQAGDVTIGQVLTVLPFGNTVATLGLLGSDVIVALENGVSQYQTQAGRFPQVGGMRYVFNPDLPVGSRIVSAEVENPDGSFSPIDPATIYQVTTNDFLRRGGDGYTVFFTNAIDPYDTWAVMADSVIEYIQAPEAAGGQGGTVTTQAYPPTGEGRIVITYNPAGNLVPNPGFEQSGGMRGPWAWFSEDVAYAWDTAVKHSGSYAVSVDLPLCNGGLDGNCVNRWWNPTGYFFTPGAARLQFGGYVKADNLSGFAGFRIQFFDAADNYLGFRDVIRQGVYLADFDWTRLDTTVFVPAGAAKARMDTFLLGTGKLWFDDVYAVAQPLPW
jgi:5'-nucleotidase